MDQLQIFCFPAASQISGKPGAVKTLRKDMLQEHSDEIYASDGECLLSAVVSIVLVTEGNVSIRYGDNVAVGDGRPKGIAGQVTDRVASVVEGLTDKWNPCFLKKSVNELLLATGIKKFFGPG